MRGRGPLREASHTSPGSTSPDSYTGSERAGSVCTAVASLRGGDLVFAGRLSHTSGRSTWAVTGGTRRWSGARGTVALEQIDDAHTGLTIRLLR